MNSDVQNLPNSYFRGPIFPQKIEELLPEWCKESVLQQKSKERLRIIESIQSKFSEFVSFYTQNLVQEERMYDIFYYICLILTEWAKLKFITMNLEYIAHPCFTLVGLLGPLSTNVAKHIVNKGFEEELEVSRKFLFSVLQDYFHDLDSLKEAVNDPVYRGTFFFKDEFCTSRIGHPL